MTAIEETRVRGCTFEEESLIYPVCTGKRTYLKGLRFHDLRTTGMTPMGDVGIPEFVVREFSLREKYETFMK